MATLAFNDRTVANLKQPGDYTFTTQPGLWLRVGKNRKTWLIRFYGQGANASARTSAITR